MQKFLYINIRANRWIYIRMGTNTSLLLIIQIKTQNTWTPLKRSNETSKHTNKNPLIWSLWLSYYTVARPQLNELSECVALFLFAFESNGMQIDLVADEDEARRRNLHLFGVMVCTTHCVVCVCHSEL